MICATFASILLFLSRILSAPQNREESIQDQVGASFTYIFGMTRTTTTFLFVLELKTLLEKSCLALKQ